MNRVRVNLINLLDVRMWVFELKDSVTLMDIERTVSLSHPGNFRIISWANPDETGLTGAFEVIMEFPHKEDMMEWVLKWA